jgi:hypothetical protein
MDQLVRNERAKLTATYLNGIAIAIFAVGGLAPVISAASSASVISLPATMSTAICLFASVAPHFVARRVLKGLQQ